MSLIRLLRVGTLALGIAALACEAAPNPQPTGCQTDYDCKSDRYCVNGQCVGGSVDSTSPNLCNDYCSVVSSCCESEGKSWSDQCGSSTECLSYCAVMNSDQTFTKETQAMVDLHFSEGCCYFSAKDGCKESPK